MHHHGSLREFVPVSNPHRDRVLIHAPASTARRGAALAGVVLCLLVVAAPTHAGIVDTVILADGTPGPYVLGSAFVDETTIEVSFPDSAAGPVPDYIYVERVNGLLFSEPLDSGRAILVCYRTRYPGLSKSYSLYQRTVVTAGDTVVAPLGPARTTRLLAGEEALTVSGFKSVGVSMGSQGRMNLEQAMDVRVFGKIAKNTEISANLTDQGTSLEGDTREIGEIDMLYIALKNPLYNIVAGDQYVSLPEDGLLSGHKKIKGLAAAYTGHGANVKGFGAISGGKYAIQTLEGVLGFQGPYYLTGNGEPDLITPIGGTVRVWVDGERVGEGEDADYVVDYGFGAVTFTERLLIHDRSRIRIEYEYKAFDYQRLFWGTDIGYAALDSVVSVRGAVWYEADNKNRPIDIELDSLTRARLRDSGDRPPLFPTGRRIHPNDVEPRSSVERLYTLDSVAGEWFYVYEPSPVDTQGLYVVWFSRVPRGTGDYAEDTAYAPDFRGSVYVYAGAGNGSYTALGTASAPRRAVLGEMVATLHPTDWVTACIEIAGEEADSNLFSPLDDENNTASASRASLLLGMRTYDERSLWLDGRHTYSSRRFSREPVSPYDRRIQWDREYSNPRGVSLHVWDMCMGGTALPGLSSEFTYGQFLLDEALYTHRLRNSTRYSPVDKVTLTYTGDFFRHLVSCDTRRFRHDQVEARFDDSRFTYGLRGGDEWRVRSAQENGGTISAGADFMFKPLQLRESLTYEQDRKGGKSIFLPLESHSRDTGSTFHWEQGIACEPVPGWSLSGTSAYHRRRELDTRRSVLLVTAGNSVRSVKAGISTNQNYRLSSEKASAFVQIPVYVGTGRGTHSLDTNRNEYQSDRFGSYIITEREMFDTTKHERVRKTSFSGDWYFRPQGSRIPGILGDIGWHGAYGIDEHLFSSGRTPASTWLPGYTSLNGRNRELLTYADLFYRQDADWRPKKRQVHVNLFVRPYLRKLRSFDEHGREAGAGWDRRRDKWQLTAQARTHKLERYDSFLASADTTTISDRYFACEERFYFTSFLSAFARERVGWAKRDPQSDETGSGYYYRIQPGLTFESTGKGWAEASYTWSRVDINGPVEFPMAQGFGRDISHVLDVIVDITVGDHFSISAGYRGERNEYLDEKWLHVVSTELKGYL